jgi:4-hydroxy-tetrahydrodipicolinate reductase
MEDCFMKPYRVTVSGLSGNLNEGKMARLLADRLDSVRNEGKFDLVKSSMTGPDVRDVWFITPSGTKIALYSRTIPDEFFASGPTDEVGKLLAMDATAPAAVNNNAERYCEYLIPFVMLTTGGDREKLVKTVEQSQTCAVIASNMSVPIVLLMSMFKYAAETFPGALAGYDVTIAESHQKAKKDKSGTAIAIGKLLKVLGLKNTEEAGIRDIRELPEQRAMGIPESALGGHAFHSYAITPPNGNLVLKFEHNIIGRETYVDGAMMALEFLAKKVELGIKGRVFSMTDVLMGV